MNVHEPLIAPTMRSFTTLIGCTLAVMSAIGQVPYASSMLDVNNVHALFHSNGVISEETGMPHFFVPATSPNTGPSPLYNASIWIGGLDADSILRFAGERYEQVGRDLFPGPLGTNASISPVVSAAYDVVHKVQRIDLLQQAAYFACLADPNCDEQTAFPGYTVPDYFFHWPAHGNTDLGQAYNLADFQDVDQDGAYEPENGDMPCVPGDQALFSIYNDKLEAHTESGGTPIGVEIHMTPFAYSSNALAVNQSIFVRYRIFNRGTSTLRGCYIGLFDDFDLGCATDDYVQCDVGRSMFFVLNGDDTDEDCNGAQGYGSPGPAFAVVVLKGPLMDADGTDNTEATALGAFNGTGLEDGIVDNERLGMGRFGYFSNNGSPMGDPYTANEYYSYLTGTWKDGTPITYGGTGYSPGTDSVPSRFVFPGDTDPAGWGTGGVSQAPWTQASAGLMPGDQRGYAALGPFTFAPGDEQEIVLAYVHAQPTSIGVDPRIASLDQRVDSIRAFAATIPGIISGEFDCSQAPTGISGRADKDPGIHLFPNPVDEELSVLLPADALKASITFSTRRATR